MAAKTNIFTKTRIIYTALFIISGITLVNFLIQFRNNAKYVNNLKNEIIANDSIGEDTTTLLKELKNFTNHHMNSSITVELIDSYNRAKTVAQNSQQINSEVYTKAQVACASKGNSIVQANCVNNYLSKNTPANTNTQVIPMPNKNDYIFTYKSPWLTTDLCGIMLLLSLATLGAGLWLYGLKKS